MSQRKYDFPDEVSCDQKLCETDRRLIEPFYSLLCNERALA